MSKPMPQPAHAGFYLFLRLRWLAAAAQLLLGAYCIFKLRLSLPWSVLGTVTGYLLTTNFLLWSLRTRFQPFAGTLLPGLLFQDTLMLSLMLYVSGGLQNPFLVVYLLHVVIAALMLSPRQTAGLLLFTGVAMFVLSFSPYPLYSVETLRSGANSNLHIRGVLLAQLGVAAGIGWFVYQLRRDLESTREDLRRRDEQLTRAHQFEALATFASGMAHELATPLGTIALVSAEMDRKACTLCQSASCSEDAKLIRNEVERCKHLLTRLRQTDALDKHLVPESVDIASLPTELSPHLAAQHAARLHWDLVPPSLAPSLPKHGLLQALSILVKNACEADPTHHPVRLRFREENRQLIFSVQDQGEGMDTETQSKLGEPFFTTKQPGFGTGLGLFLVRTFLDQTGGELGVETAPGKGTTIELRIPAS